MSWHEEINLSKLKTEMIGAAFFIRETMKNDWHATEDDLIVRFGENWRTILEKLKLHAKLHVEKTGKLYHLSIRANGDKKRARAKARMQKARNKKGKAT